MNAIRHGTLLWQPTDEVRQNANLTAYMDWLAKDLGRRFDDYRGLWEWSVTEIEEFWMSIWRYFQLKASSEPDTILSSREMPGSKWFDGASLNYAENIFERMTERQPAIIFKSEDNPYRTVARREIASKVASLAHYLRQAGVVPGDRVVAYMPNIPETIMALLAVSSLGAIWSSCSPDFGSRSVLDRFQQIEPKVLIAVDGYRYGGKRYERLRVLKELQEGLPSLERTILVRQVSDERESAELENMIGWSDIVATKRDPTDLEFEQLPFDHPLWVLYSSGTTGLPKPIVQGQGGILLEHFKMSVLHLDLKPQDHFFWYTSTGWMMWNFLVGGLLSGCSIVVYDGSPGYPSLDVLWELADECSITYFGTSAAFVHACMKAGLKPSSSHDLSRLRALGSTGSPLSSEGFKWVYDEVNADLALESVSGGTDLCTAFVGGCRLRPVYAGEIQGPALGAKIEAYNENGRPVVGELGELVITEPMPSMPLYFWNDPENKRYQESYFEMYPGIWRHGDWIEFNENLGCVIYGRSDSTINRQGIRMGTSEIYRIVESVPEVVDSLVIDLEALGRESFMPLFIVLGENTQLDEDLRERIRRLIRQNISPRHVPDAIIAVEEIPYTLSGKKLEVPVRRILLGDPVEKAANPGAMRNPGSLSFFIEFADKLAA